MRTPRRSFVGAVLAGTVALSGCMLGNTEFHDVDVHNRTGQPLDVQVEIELQNGQTEVVTESITIPAGEDWDWNEAGDRGISRVKIETGDGRMKEEQWEKPVDGTEINIDIEPDNIEIEFRSP